MNQQTGKNLGSGGLVIGGADETLRLIAGLRAPDGLEDRLKDGLRRAPANHRADLLAWPLGARGRWLQGSWVRGAAAAAIVAIVAGGSWEVYSRVRPAQVQIAFPRVGGSGGFASANAVRTPKTLDAPTVPQTGKPGTGQGKKQIDAKKKPVGEHSDALQPVAR